MRERPRSAHPRSSGGVGLGSIADEGSCEDSDASSSACSIGGSRAREIIERGHWKREQEQWHQDAQIATDARLGEAVNAASISSAQQQLSRLESAVVHDWGADHAIRQQIADNREEAAAAKAAAAASAAVATLASQAGMSGTNGADKLSTGRRPGLPGYTQWLRLRREGMTDAEQAMAAGEDELAAYYDWLLEAQQHEDAAAAAHQP